MSFRFKPRKRPSSRTLLSLVLVATALWSILTVGTYAGFKPDSLSTVLEILSYAFRPDLSPGYVYQTFQDTLTTAAYAVCAMSLAVLLGFSGGVMSSGVLYGKALGQASRFFLAVLRAIHELIWALLLVQAFGLSPWTGVLAIAIPYGSILGRIFADQIKDAPKNQLAGLQTTGASKFMLLLYGRLPSMKAPVFSYLAYRFECALRSSAVLSFVGLGGLGFRIEIALRDLDFAKAWTPIWFLIILIAGFDYLISRSKSFQPL